MPSNRLQIAILGFILLSGCSSESGPTAPAAGAETEATDSIGILMYGDSGYLLEYPDQDDYQELFDADQYLEKERADWLEDKRPPELFQARPSANSPVTGKVVPDTGLHIVSAAMKVWCRDSAVCDFGTMLGDNIYPSGLTFGADGFDDEARLRHMFEEPLGDLVQNPPGFITYATLGNHDWETSRAGGFAEIDYLEDATPFYMDGPFYTVKPPTANGEIELFIVDTSMILASVEVMEDELADDGSEIVTNTVDVPDYFVEPLTQAERDQPLWLEEKLRASTAKWKIVVAHHPIWSSSGSKFEQARALRNLLLPAMCRYADAYVVGHDHTLEIHTDDCSAALGEATEQPLVQIVSGAAAKQRPVNENFMHHQELKYPEHKTIWARGLIWGFAYMQLEGDKASVDLIVVSPEGSEIAFEYAFSRRSHLGQAKSP